MKKFISVLLIGAMVFAFTACGGDKNEDAGADEQGGTTAESGAIDYNSIPDTMESEDGKYQIAFITDVGALKDQSFNEFTWNGVKAYASENGKSYKYYQPANDQAATDADRYDAMKAAADSGAEVIVAAGYLQQPGSLEQTLTVLK